MFLEILTRHLATRPTLLDENQASLAALTDDDWHQTVLVDCQGRGVENANARLAGHSFRVRGDYVWVLDDDDACCRPTLIKELKDFAAAGAEVVIMRMDHGPRGILPPDKFWPGEPVKGAIGASAFVVTRFLWQRFGYRWDAYRAGDYEFISAVWQSNPKVFWHDVIASRVQTLGSGKPETELEVIPWPR